MSHVQSLAFQGEVMLLRWGDTSQSGATVTFLLHPDDAGEVHPFRGLPTGAKNGQRFKLYCLPVSDEEPTATGQPPQQKPPVEPSQGQQERRKWDELPLAQQAGIREHEPKFQEFLAKHYPYAWEAAVMSADTNAPEAFAAEATRGICGVKTRAMLANNLAGKRWRELEAQYQTWLRYGDQR